MAVEHSVLARLAQAAQDVVCLAVVLLVVQHVVALAVQA
jgi:hypothetical protein